MGNEFEMGIVNFIRYNHHKKITLEAYMYSAVYRLCILIVKPNCLRKYWGIEGIESAMEEDIEAYRYAKRVARSVDHVCGKTAWESRCLVRALTAQHLLKKKHISSTLYLGCGIVEGKMSAHAWLRCGKMYVTGGDGTGYAVVDMFCVE